MKVYVTKYALTVGITTHEAHLCEPDSMIEITDARYTTYFHKPFWHTDRDEAIQHANDMRVRKLIALRKQITLLEARSFEGVK